MYTYAYIICTYNLDKLYKFTQTEIRPRDNSANPTMIPVRSRCEVTEIQLTWWVVSTPLKNISQLGWLFPIYARIKNVPKCSKPPTSYQFMATKMASNCPRLTETLWGISHPCCTQNLSPPFNVGLPRLRNLRITEWPGKNVVTGYLNNGI